MHTIVTRQRQAPEVREYFLQARAMAEKDPKGARVHLRLARMFLTYAPATPKPTGFDELWLKIETTLTVTPPTVH